MKKNPHPPVQIRDRKTGQLSTEPLFSESAMRFLFDSKLGLFLSEHFITKTWFSRIYGRAKNLPGSRNQIQAFIEQYGVAMEDFETPAFQNFNQFFYRHFREGRRPFPSEAGVFGSPGEGRALAFAKTSECPFLPVKNQKVGLEKLVGSNAIDLSAFQDGPVMILRLSPIDYHRFHAPDRGSVLFEKLVPGDLYTVHPFGWSSRPDVFFRNQRVVRILETENFGKLLYIAVGGFVVGRILSSLQNKNFERGQELGWFELGGSTLVIIGEAGRIKVDVDLLAAGQERIESFVRLGEKIAVKS